MDFAQEPLLGSILTSHLNLSFSGVLLGLGLGVVVDVVVVTTVVPLLVVLLVMLVLLEVLLLLLLLLEDELLLVVLKAWVILVVSVSVSVVASILVSVLVSYFFAPVVKVMKLVMIIVWGGMVLGVIVMSTKLTVVSVLPWPGVSSSREPVLEGTSSSVLEGSSLVLEGSSLVLEGSSSSPS